MAPMGFEPTTPGLRVQCSDQAELRSHLSIIVFVFKKSPSELFLNYKRQINLWEF